ncbi:tripartite tricarboxylate transporter substrate-binding protein [Roseomonas sp. NAR14]|uniref:Tripartite tricarboxylate transporter substrate-binding protein n=1 Tax=Roseomonas acroporae TaxID=2937791 RepID=A0A9X1Y7H4_9PROT|nr:tripartite tricarboxylate transporter substrate-binding protein [Roseomonas acroporae]MCK8784968.1 tripartite tricarboxylate transporter substrate-binding protein [Roseomonas acroporae]
MVASVVPARPRPHRSPAHGSAGQRAALGHLRRRRLVGATLVAAAAGRPARAASPWPERPVRLLAAMPPGSTPDLIARALAPVLAARFGQPFVVENRPGAGGTLAAGAVAQAGIGSGAGSGAGSGDGHVLGIVMGGPTTTARALNPALPYDPARDFTPVSLLVRAPFLVAVHPALPAADLMGLVALARAEPGRLSYGSVGPGTVTHLAIEEFKARHGIAIEHVAYRGFAEMTLDLIAGRIQLGLDTPFNGVPAVREGRLSALAVTGTRRFDDLPAVPTVAEAGDPAAACFGWTGLVAPAGFPAERARALAAAVREGLAEPSLRAVLGQQATEIVGSDPAEFAALQRAEAARWIAVIERLGLRAG